MGTDKFEPGDYSDARWAKFNSFVMHNVKLREKYSLRMLSIFIGNGRILH